MTRNMIIFLRAALSVIKSDVIVAAKEFFYIGKMYKPVNCTTVTLIPKIVNPKSVKKYRPIACCTMLYKMISRVLARRMQKVIASIICEAQARFIPGRKISYSTILAHEQMQAYARKHISARSLLKIDLQKTCDSVEWVYLQQLL